MKSKILYIALFIVFLIDLILVWQNQTESRFFTKTLLLPLLILIYFSESKIINKLFVSGLVFSFLGDLFLLFDWGFLAGLGSFLLAHIFYIISFSKFSKKKPSIPFIIALLLYVSGLIFFLYPHLNEMKIPVIFYGIIIAVMLYFAVKTTDKTLILGALFFVVSDSILAINLFEKETQILSILVMFTYLFAQFLLVKGMISYSKKSEI